MGTFNTSGTYGAHWFGDVNPSVNSQNAAANQSSIHVSLVMRTDNPGVYGVNAGTSYDVYVNGGNIGNGSRTIALGSGGGGGTSTELVSGDVTVNHDVNGNWSGTVGGDLSCSYSGVGSGNGTYGYSVPRLALAPSISSVISDTIKPTTARLGGELSSFGHGTGATWEMFYRLQGSGTWISLGQQADVNGYNFWYPTGLKPGKIYEQIANCTNNNGDFAQSATFTFKTQAVSGMISVMRGII